MDSPKSEPRMLRHRAPGGGRCEQKLAYPVLNAAGETVGWQCIGCGTLRAIRATRIQRKVPTPGT